MELGLRFLLFSDNPGIRKATTRLRSAGHYALQSSPDYWKLLRLFANGKRKEANHDPVLGWMPELVEAATYDHEEHDPRDARRPVLLYGDSFAQCVTGADACWQAIMERSELAADYKLLNYGVGGYGFDQAFLMMRQSLDNYAAEDPIVVLSLFLDSDLDRSVLPFRGWPKPRFEISSDGQLTLPGQVARDPLAYLAANPPRIRSYLWRYLLHATKLIPAKQRFHWNGKAELAKEIRRLNRHILEEAHRLLESRGIEYFVLLFHGRGYFRTPPADKWREAYFTKELDKLGMPWVSSLEVLQEHMAESGKTSQEYFIVRGHGEGHYNPFGNEVVFEALRRGIAKNYTGVPMPDAIDAPTDRVLPGPASFARYGNKPLPPFKADEDTPRWVLGADPAGETQLRFRLFRQARSFEAILKPVPGKRLNEDSLKLVLWCDGEARRTLTLEPQAPPQPVEVDLEGVDDFRIQWGGAGTAGVALLASPNIQIE